MRCVYRVKTLPFDSVNYGELGIYGSIRDSLLAILSTDDIISISDYVREMVIYKAHSSLIEWVRALDWIYFSPTPSDYNLCSRNVKYIIEKIEL